MCKKNGNINNEAENLKREQKKTLDLKRMTEITNSLGQFKGRCEYKADRISKLEDRAIESIKSKK